MNASGSPRLAFSPTTAPPNDLDRLSGRTVEADPNDQRLRVGEVYQDESVACRPRVQERVLGFRNHLLPVDLSTLVKGVQIDSDEPPGLGLEISSQIESGRVRSGQHEFGIGLIDDLDRTSELTALTCMIGYTQRRFLFSVPSTMLTTRKRSSSVTSAQNIS